MAGEERSTFLATPAASRAVVELGAVPAAPGGSGSGSGEEKKAHADDGDCEQGVPRLGADAGAGAMIRGSEGSSTSSATALAE